MSLAAVGGALGIAVSGGAYRRAKGILVRRLAVWLSAAVEVHELGREHLVRHPEASVETLVAHLSDDLVTNPFSVSDERLRQLFQARVVQDFEQNRTTKLGGWTFSTTELRLCGLAYLWSGDAAEAPALGVVADRAVTPARITRTQLEAAEGDDTGAFLFEDSVDVYLERVFRPTRVEFSLDTSVNYRLSYVYDDAEVAGHDVLRRVAQGGGPTGYRFDVPAGVTEVDQIRIVTRREPFNERLGIHVRQRYQPPHRLSNLLIEENA